MSQAGLPRSCTPHARLPRVHRTSSRRSEPARVGAPVAKPSVEALDVAVLHRSARLDMHQSLTFQSSAQASIRREVNPDSGCPSARSPGGHARRSPVPAPVSRDRYPGWCRPPAPDTRGVHTSTTLRIRTIRPVARPSTMKSIAHSWLGPGSAAVRSLVRAPARLRPLRSHHQALLHIQPVDTLQRSPPGHDGPTARAAAGNRVAEASAAPTSPTRLVTPTLRSGPRLVRR